MTHRYNANDIDDFDQFVTRHYPDQLVLTLQPSERDDEAQVIIYLEHELNAVKDQIEQGCNIRGMVPADLAGRLDLYRNGKKVTGELDGS